MRGLSRIYLTYSFAIFNAALSEPRAVATGSQPS